MNMKPRMKAKPRIPSLVTPMALLAALLLFLVPGTAQAQDAEERIQSALEQATEAGIPTELLESKVAEGRAKGVPADRIADAVERRQQGLERAREALAGSGDVDAATLSAGADAIGSGVSESVLEAVADRSSGTQRAAALAALGTLVEQGVAPEQALEAVERALARGPEALANLPAQAGGPPADRPGAEGGPPSSIPVPGDVPGQGPPDDVGPPDGSGPPDGAGPPGA